MGSDVVFDFKPKVFSSLIRGPADVSEKIHPRVKGLVTLVFNRAKVQYQPATVLKKMIADLAKLAKTGVGVRTYANYFEGAQRVKVMRTLDAIRWSKKENQWFKESIKILKEIHKELQVAQDAWNEVFREGIQQLPPKLQKEIRAYQKTAKWLPYLTLKSEQQEFRIPSISHSILYDMLPADSFSKPTNRRVKLILTTNDPELRAKSEAAGIQPHLLNKTMAISGDIINKQVFLQYVQRGKYRHSKREKETRQKWKSVYGLDFILAMLLFIHFIKKTFGFTLTSVNWLISEYAKKDPWERNAFRNPFELSEVREFVDLWETKFHILPKVYVRSDTVTYKYTLPLSSMK